MAKHRPDPWERAAQAAAEIDVLAAEPVKPGPVDPELAVALLARCKARSEGWRDAKPGTRARHILRVLEDAKLLPLAERGRREMSTSLKGAAKGNGKRWPNQQAEYAALRKRAEAHRRRNSDKHITDRAMAEYLGEPRSKLERAGVIGKNRK